MGDRAGGLVEVDLGPVQSLLGVPNVRRLLNHAGDRLGGKCGIHAVHLGDAVDSGQGCHETFDVTVPHLPPEVAKSVLDMSSLDEGPHDVSLLAVQRQVAPIRFDQRVVRLSGEVCFSRRARLIQLFVEVGDHLGEEILLVREVSVQAAHRYSGLFGDITHPRVHVTVAGEDLTPRVDEVGAGAQALGSCGLCGHREHSARIGERCEADHKVKRCRF